MLPQSTGCHLDFQKNLPICYHIQLKHPSNPFGLDQQLISKDPISACRSSCRLRVQRGVPSSNAAVAVPNQMMLASNNRCPMRPNKSSRMLGKKNGGFTSQQKGIRKEKEVTKREKCILSHLFWAFEMAKPRTIIKLSNPINALYTGSRGVSWTQMDALLLFDLIKDADSSVAPFQVMLRWTLATQPTHLWFGKSNTARCPVHLSTSSVFAVLPKLWYSSQSLSST